MLPLDMTKNQRIFSNSRCQLYTLTYRVCSICSGWFQGSNPIFELARNTSISFSLLKKAIPKLPALTSKVEARSLKVPRFKFICSVSVRQGRVSRHDAKSVVVLSGGRRRCEVREIEKIEGSNKSYAKV